MHNPKFTEGTRSFFALLIISLLFCAPNALAKSLSRTALYLGSPELRSSYPEDPWYRLPSDLDSDRPGCNYLNDVAADGLYCWPRAHLPVKVFFQSGVGVPGFKDSYKNILIDSFDEWVQASEGKLAWLEVPTPQEADVVCR